MPLIQLPSYAKISELQLCVQSSVETKRRPFNRSRAPAASLREMWRGQVAFAPMTAANARAFVAWLAALDGRVTPFALPLTQGFATHANTLSATVRASSAGAGIVTLASGNPVSVEAGTLLTLGTPGEPTSHVVEVVERGYFGTGYSLAIAPRLHADIASGTAITGGDVSLPVRLSSDLADVQGQALTGIFTIGVIEAVL